MALIYHDISQPMDGFGDELRDAFDSQNQMNAELYTNKVDKENGKALSTNDFTTIEKSKLENIQEFAEVNVQSDCAQNDTTAADYIKNKPDFFDTSNFYQKKYKSSVKLNLLDGSSIQLDASLKENYIIESAGYSIHGFDFNSGSKKQDPFDWMYVFLTNKTANSVFLRDYQAGLPSPPAILFKFRTSENFGINLPPNETIMFRFDLANNQLEEVFRSWKNPELEVVTRSEFMALIDSNALIPTQKYKVTAIDNNWCDGFFTALSPNTFDPNGTGLFKNPNYSLYQLWTNQFYRGVTTTVGTPILDEVYTLAGNSFIWKTAGLYITNQNSLPDGIYTSGAKSVTVSSADVTSYNVNDIVIFGNKHWKNENGNLGGKIDELNLDSEWTQVFTNLIPALDLINYDITNDWINERKDSKGNELSLTKAQSDNEYADNFNYIKTFNWGKDGSDNNKITNWFGVVCNLNFRIYGSNGNGFYIYNNTGIYFSLNNNNGNGFSFYNNAGYYLNFSNNTVSGFNFNNNTVSSLYFSNNMGSGFNFNNITGINFTISNNTGIGFSIYNITGSSFNLYNITVSDFGLRNQVLISKTIKFGDFKDINITTDISTATILFQNGAKSVFRNSADAQIITYYNANNVLVVANITD